MQNATHMMDNVKLNHHATGFLGFGVKGLIKKNKFPIEACIEIYANIILSLIIQAFESYNLWCVINYHSPEYYQGNTSKNTQGQQ